MSAKDQTAALRSRRDQPGAPASTQVAATGRPADLVITADMIPDPLNVDVTGDLTHSEIHDLGVCERAVDNLATARWLAGKALQSIRDRKLYRHTHATFEEYVQDRWDMSERAAYQAIEEWPLAERLQRALGKPATPSHTRALLPVAHRFGLASAVDLYQQLGPRAVDDGLRLTAALTSRVVQAVLAQTGTEAEAPQFQEAARQLMSAEALPALETAKAPAATPAPTTTKLSLDPPAPAAGDRSTEAVAAAVEERDLQNFTGDHEQVTTVGVVIEPVQSLPRELPDSVSAAEVLAYLRSILQRVREVEAAIDSLVGVDQFQEGEAENLRQEIHRRLLRAAQPYRPYVSARRNG